MEINNTTIHVYHSNRWFGFAPYTVETNKLNQIENVKGNRFWIVYSVTLVISLTMLSNYGLYCDTNSAHPLRMKTPTSRVVIGFDMNVVVFSCVVGMLCSIFGLQNTQKLNAFLNTADQKLFSIRKTISVHTISTKRHSIIFIIIVYIYIGSMLALDVYGYVRIATKLRLRDQNAAFIDQNVFYYVPFYMMYVLFTTLHVKFAYPTLRIGLRYRLLNKLLTDSMPFQSAFWKLNEPINRSTIGLNLKYHSFVDAINHAKNDSLYLRRTSDDIINQFAETHQELGKAMVNVSSEFGVTILILLVSCLLHLVITGYFFLLEVFGEQDGFRLSLQALWLLFHALRLLAIVEPCHLVATEANKTMKIVCNLLRCHAEQTELNKFWQQLLADNTYFSACGMCRIDRRLLTNIGGAIATYLVILMQFQKSDNESFVKPINRSIQ